MSNFVYELRGVDKSYYDSEKNHVTTLFPYRIGRGTKTLSNLWCGIAVTDTERKHKKVTITIINFIVV